MAEESLKRKTISSLVWTATQRFGILFLGFASNLILVRFLTPEDYGVVGMISIFISLSETFINSGLGAALIQKKEPTELDFSTVFWSNLTISIFFYVLLFFCAPLISNFYGMEILTPILRIKGTILIIQGFRIIQTTRLQKNLDFKKISIVYLISTFSATIISIVCAFLGLGLWSLVIKSMAETFLRTVLLWLVGNWRPILQFSMSSFKELFSYGGVMLSTSIVITLYSNLIPLIIGKAFSATELGYYTQAAKLEEVPTKAFEQITNQVTFPVFSKIKDETEKIRKGFRKIITNISYITFPLMVFFVVAATPIFNFLFTEKWAPSIPYFRFLCIVGMMVSVNTINTNLVKASGRKKTYFSLQVIKRIIGAIILVFSVYFEMVGLLIARIIIEYIFFFINARTTAKIIEHSTWSQIKDFAPNYILAFAVGVATYFIFKNINLSNILMILLQGLAYFGLYFTVSGLLKFKAFTSYKEILFSKVKKDKK